MIDYKTHLIGKQYGSITVLECVGKSPRGHLIWNCKCNFCKSEKNIRSDSLCRTKSCGCIVKRTGKNHKDWKGYEEISQSFWTVLKRGAVSRNLELDISIEQVWNLFLKQDGKCALTGLPLIFGTKRTAFDRTASLDRKDSSKGYTLDNVQWVHKQINEMKMAQSQEEFVRFCILVANNFQSGVLGANP